MEVKLKKDWVVWGGCLGLFCAGAVFSNLFPPSTWSIWSGALTWINSNPNLAAWVQAFGAIAAIGIAIWVPYRQRAQEAKERANTKMEIEVSRAEQLLSICKELNYLVGFVPLEYVSADYQLTNEMSRKIFADLIERLNHLQKNETSAELLELSLDLRIKLYDWLKFFSDGEEHDGSPLYNKSERELPRIEALQIKIANVGRGLRGEAALEIVKPEPQEPDFPF